MKLLLTLATVLVMGCADDPSAPGLYEKQPCYPRASHTAVLDTDQYGRPAYFCRLAVDVNDPDEFTVEPQHLGGGGGGVFLNTLHGGDFYTRRAADGWYGPRAQLIDEGEIIANGDIVVLSTPLVNNENSCVWVDCDGSAIKFADTPMALPMPWTP